MTASTALPTGVWQVDATATTVTVAVRKLAMFDIPATLAVRSGTIEIDENHQVGEVNIVVDASSYASKSAKRNEHVVGKDFLDVDSHPTVAFRATTAAASDDGYEVSGTLSVKGQAFPIDVVITGVSFTDTDGSFTATAVVDRKAIGVDKMPAFIIGQNLSLTVHAKVQRSTT